MLEHVYRRARQTPGVSDVLIATDDARVRDAAAAFGATAVMTRATHPSGTDRLAEVAGALDAAVIVNVQADEPLVEPAMIAAAAAGVSLDATGPGIATLRKAIIDTAELRNPNVVKVVVGLDGRALYFSRAAVPHGRDGGPVQAWRHVGLYAYRRDTLLALAGLAPTPLEQAEALEQLRWLEHGYAITTLETTYDTIGVDTPEDLERVRTRLAAQPQPVK